MFVLIGASGSKRRPTVNGMSNDAGSQVYCLPVLEVADPEACSNDPKGPKDLIIRYSVLG